MKRLIFVLMSLFVMLTANAQHDGFVCTGNNVNVRTGPGKNYAIYDTGDGHKRQLSKGDGKRMGSVLSKDHWNGEETREMVGCQHNISVL